MIRAEIRFKNSTFMDALEKSKYSSIAELSRVSGISLKQLYDIASLRYTPSDMNIQTKIAEALSCDIYDLFEQYEEIVHKNKGCVRKLTADIPVDKMLSLSSSKILQLESDNDIEYESNQNGLKIELNEALKYLKDREKTVIELYFGLNRNKKITLNDIAKEYNVSPQRVRQIKEKAIRRLRRRGRAIPLKKFLGGEKETSNY